MALCKAFRRSSGDNVQALDHVSLDIRHGTLAALVGPDGSGKTTLLRMVAGLIAPDSGKLEVLGINVTADPQQIQSRISYMPQKFGLYEDLSVQENLDLYADLHGVTPDAKSLRYVQLMQMTNLGSFTDRLAGHLSGGMKQKLGLACTLVRSPELLLLDEPTVGVDPLSRRELWEIILRLVREENLTVLMSTAYLDEADRCNHAVVLHQGKVLVQGPPGEVTKLAIGRVFLVEPPEGQPARNLQAQCFDEPGIVDAVPEGGLVRLVLRSENNINAGNLATPFLQKGGQGGLSELAPLDGLAVYPVPPRFEDGFMLLLHQLGNMAEPVSADSVRQNPPADKGHSETVIEVHDLVKKFGVFTAVDHVSFEVYRGEIFGLLGPNGAGKTTTFRMLCGLLAATAGMLRVAGEDLRVARASARQRIGYVAQKFALYGQLSVIENLEFFASAYGLRGRHKRDRIDWALQHFELVQLAKLPSEQLPGGYKQRLAMAAALLHEPEILFLDEPTSGADPLARREFWQRITLFAEKGVTVIVTTHFMEEAEYCDRAVIQDAGRLLAKGTPAEIRMWADSRGGQRPSMEDAFIAIVEMAREKASTVAMEAA